MFAGTGVWKSKRGAALLGCRRAFINDEQYGYNARDELTSADEISYNYDDIGNRTTAEGKTYTANNLNQYTAIDDFVPEYDADGNQTLIQTSTLAGNLQRRKPPHPLGTIRHRRHNGF